MKKRKFHITLDIDWAPDSSILRCLNLLSKAKVKATFFATHHTDFNNEIILQGHELGIHPNFCSNTTHGTSVKEIIETCLEFAPNASCIRTHCLYQSSQLLYEIFSNFSQLKLDLSLLMHKGPYIQKCTWNFKGTDFQRIMYNWADDMSFYDKEPLKISSKFFGPITIYGFHPIHVHLNSSNGSEYDALKEYCVSKKLNHLSESQVRKFHNNSFGIEDFFVEILNSNNINIQLKDIK